MQVFSRLLWDSLFHVHQALSDSLFVIGNFNVMFGAHEKTSRPFSKVSCDEFQNAVTLLNFLSIDTHSFTLGLTKELVAMLSVD